MRLRAGALLALNIVTAVIGATMFTLGLIVGATAHLLEQSLASDPPQRPYQEPDAPIVGQPAAVFIPPSATQLGNN